MQHATESIKDWRSTLADHAETAADELRNNVSDADIRAWTTDDPHAFAYLVREVARLDAKAGCARVSKPLSPHYSAHKAAELKMRLQHAAFCAQEKQRKYAASGDLENLIQACAAEGNCWGWYEFVIEFTFYTERGDAEASIYSDLEPLSRQFI